MLVELKNGETLNGHLIQCDTWMNLTLKEVIQTSPVRAHESITQLRAYWLIRVFRKPTRSFVYLRST